jgi:curli biogenesis system outer membrane secretion channel CsgG
MRNIGPIRYGRSYMSTRITMKPYAVVAALAIAILQGFSSESAKRTAFETLQNMREQQCEQDLSSRCPPRESYAEYQRKRKEASD